MADLQHKPEHMAKVVAAALSAHGVKTSQAEALALVSTYLAAAPYPPEPVSVAEKLVAGVVRALR